MTPDHSPLGRPELLAFLGPPRDRVPLEPKVLETVDCGSHVREKVTYAVAEGVRVPAYVCRPVDVKEPVAAVFCHHQHNGEFHLGKSEPVGLAGNPELAYAAELADRGYVTIAPDAIGFEERNWSDDVHDNVTWFELSNRLVLGRTLLADCLQEISCAIDYLATRPDTDLARLGFIGHSYGGRAALWAPAFDPRFRASVSNCGCIPYRDSYTHDTGVQAEFVLPGFAATYDLPDVIALTEGHLLISAGSDDKWSRGAQDVHDQAEQVLRDRIELAIYPVGHVFTESMRAAAYAFLDRHLRTPSPGVSQTHVVDVTP